MRVIPVNNHLSEDKYHIQLKKVAHTNTFVRSTSILFLGVMIWNLVWILFNLDLHNLLQTMLTGLFIVASSMVFIYACIHTINSWHFRSVEPKLLSGSVSPKVAVIIPTYGESIEIVENTVKTVLSQRWPSSKLLIVVSDDGYNDALKDTIECINLRSTAELVYMRPPRKGDPFRRGESKAGNLNAALDYVVHNYPDIEFIEPRDADDLVVNRHFISYCLEYLIAHPETSYVQTIKQCRVSKDDPFSNQESIFYQRSMPAKFASNAVFPCGSGLMWRKSELLKIDGFPAWNLVEDLQSGFEILKLGGSGAFLPIVGAMGQIAPEDIPNFYKQRGTWALDTLRLFYYRNPLFARGLTIWQKLHFFELEFSYLLSFAMAIFILEIILGLNFGLSPIVSSSTSFFGHLSLLAIALEAQNIARARGISYKEQWIARQTWLGLMHVFVVSALKALWYGPNRKPSYKVTRKFHKVGWYWKETLPQAVLVIVLIASVYRSIILGHDHSLQSIGIQMWALFFAYGLSRVVTNSWHNYKFSIRKPEIGSVLIQEEAL